VIVIFEVVERGERDGRFDGVDGARGECDGRPAEVAGGLSVRVRFLVKESQEGVVSRRDHCGRGGGWSVYQHHSNETDEGLSPFGGRACDWAAFSSNVRTGSSPSGSSLPNPIRLAKSASSRSKSH
jgi:hypothetical protein